LNPCWVLISKYLVPVFGRLCASLQAPLVKVTGLEHVSYTQAPPIQISVRMLLELHRKSDRATCPFLTLLPPATLTLTYLLSYLPPLYSTPQPCQAVRLSRTLFPPKPYMISTHLYPTVDPRPLPFPLVIGHLPSTTQRYGISNHLRPWRPERGGGWFGGLMYSTVRQKASRGIRCI
jgi:hypothetical protein